ncbi:ABC transporter ATP-binding protein [Subtercola endophyticus]|uniref:ABC transporter ATP-binding protein n=1 Tax=Subtercola endophyticus TaxID=2895559 RepID=UPI001E54BA22|nr:ABC transporter ATP-binding protein [Subtercola endophyticus]UFS60798.1 ABC transporter ATP-binding protein/permease [Subtercola endophyticus]
MSAEPESPAPLGWLRRLWQYMTRHRRSLYLSLAAALLGSACQVVVPLVARQIVDNVILVQDAPLLPWLGLLLALSAAVFFFAYVRRYRGGEVALEVQNDLRNDMHDHLQSMDFASLDRMSTGQLVSRANSDSTLVQSLLNMLPLMSGNVILMVLSLVVMFILSWPLALVALVVTPLLVLISYRMRNRVFPATWDAQQREGEVAEIVDEDVNGVRVVKAFGREKLEVERMVEVSSTLYGSQMRAVRIQSRYQPLLEAVPVLAQVAVLAFGGWLALNNQLTLGTFLAFSAYVAQLMAPARMLAGVLTIGQQARVGIERIFQLLDRPPAIVDAPDAVALPAAAGGRIDFDGVTFGYDPGHPVLDGFDLHIEPGERVALVGASGSGKSTVAALISRFYDPLAGSVSVEGVDVRHATLSSLRGSVGVVFEESFLFSDSVRSNIAYGRPDASDDEVIAAARIAQADGFIDRLPRGYDTVVGERGLSLSGGQRQRIALARAILCDPRILILDDATSAIDAKTEELIHDGLSHTLSNRTVLLIAHRESTLHLADRIVLVEHGRVADHGTHDELRERNATYRGLLSGLDDETRAAVADGRIEVLADLTADGTSLAEAEWELANGEFDAPADARASTSAAATSPSRNRSGFSGAASGGASGGGGEGEAGGAGGGAATSSAGTPRPRTVTGRASLGAGLGGRGGGRGGGAGMASFLAPTPELLANVAKLPPVRDIATLDVEHETTHDKRFSLLRLLSEFRRPLALGLVLVVIDAVAGLLGPVLVKTGIDDGVQAGSAAVLFAASGLYLLVTLADLLDEVASTFVTGRIAQRVMLSLRIRIWSQLQRLSLDYYEREMAGRVMTRMTTDVDQFESLIQNGLLSALVSVVTFVGVGIALLTVNFELGLCTLSVVIPLAIATVWFRQRSSKLYDVSRERIAIVNADFQESLSGVRESQAFTHEAATMARFHGLGRNYLQSRIAAQKLVATYFPFVQFLSGVADVIVLGVGAGLIASGELSSGALIAFILYIDMFFSPIQQLSQVFDSWQQTRVSVGRISDLMALETLTPEAEHPVVPGRLSGALTLSNVRFAYPSAPLVRAGGSSAPLLGPSDARPIISEDATFTKPPEALRGIDLHVAPRETLALVGETGAGKSTVMKLLARFYDVDSGQVLVDGMDVRSLDLVAFRRQLGYVPQEAFLFTGTVRENIAYGRPTASLAEVQAAARAVGADEFVAQLTDGYEHELTERGRSLSAGQRQLIALARAQLVDPAILLLDEATSNLDLATESRVTAAMQRVSEGRTTIVIAHRLQTARAADRIAVLHDGRIAEVGSHDELLAAGGRYATMWQAFEVAERPA